MENLESKKSDLFNLKIETLNTLIICYILQLVI